MNVELENYIDSLADEYARANVDIIVGFIDEHKDALLQSHLKTVLKCMVDDVIIEIRSELIKHLERELHVFGEDM